MHTKKLPEVAANEFARYCAYEIRYFFSIALDFRYWGEYNPERSVGREIGQTITETAINADGAENRYENYGNALCEILSPPRQWSRTSSCKISRSIRRENTVDRGEQFHQSTFDCRLLLSAF